MSEEEKEPRYVGISPLPPGWRRAYVDDAGAVSMMPIVAVALREDGHLQYVEPSDGELPGMYEIEYDVFGWIRILEPGEELDADDFAGIPELLEHRKQRRAERNKAAP